MTTGADWQQQQELLEQQELLTWQAVGKWMDGLSIGQVICMRVRFGNLIDAYLKEHGLPLTSKIEGL